MSTLSKLTASTAVAAALALTTLSAASADDRAEWLRLLQQQREARFAPVTPLQSGAAASQGGPRVPRATVYTRRPAGAPVAPVATYTRAPATVAAAPATSFTRAPAAVPAAPATSYTRAPVAATTSAALRQPATVAAAAPMPGGRLMPAPTRMIGGRIIMQPLTPEENRARATQNRLAALSPGGALPQMDPKFLPVVIPYEGREKPGTIVINTPEKYLYYVQADGTARRYGIGVGRPGFQWAGVHKVSMKREWPGWTPPAPMRKRQPELPAYMEGGPDNPLGARAMYLGSSIYRIHGSNAPWTIGTEVSSGCIRMRNEDVMELYELVKIGTRVIVM